MIAFMYALVKAIQAKKSFSGTSTRISQLRRGPRGLSDASLNPSTAYDQPAGLATYVHGIFMAALNLLYF